MPTVLKGEVEFESHPDAVALEAARKAAAEKAKEEDNKE